MTRLIDADELKIYISTTFCDTCKRDKGVCSSCEFDDVFVAIDYAPTIDAEPIVRCKDCKHYIDPQIEDELGVRCVRWHTARFTREDDFCSYGEGREP